MIDTKKVLFIAIAMMMYACNHTNENKQRLTMINTLSYTDVEYIGVKDSVIVSTYSGRIAKRINGIDKENLISQLNDEVYSLVFSKERNEIIASTMESGILVLDAANGRIKKRLSTGSSWINKISLSTNGKYLMGYNGQRKNFVWNVINNYQSIKYPENFPKSYVRFGKEDILYHSGGGKMILWNPETNKIETREVESGNLVDIDEKGNALILNHNEFIINYKKDTIKTIKRNHPDWPYYYASQDTIYRIPLTMKLTTATISNQTVFTGGFDRSIRFWDVQTGVLKDELLKHRATISSIKISRNQSQMVSVDLKGGIQFTELSVK